MGSSRPLKIQFKDTAYTKLKRVVSAVIDVSLAIANETIRLPCDITSVVLNLVVLNMED